MSELFTIETRTENGRKLHEVKDGQGLVWGWAFSRDAAEIIREKQIARVIESLNDPQGDEFYLQVGLPAA